MRAVLHVDEIAKWRNVIANAANIVAHCRAENLPFEIEIVANGEAVVLLTARAAAKSGMNRDMKRLAADGVAIVACTHSLESFEIPPSDLSAYVKAVPSGAIELIVRQEEGCAYIRP